MTESSAQLPSLKTEYLDAIVATMREPFLVLNRDLRIQAANQSFYKRFRVLPKDTKNQLLYRLDNGRWNIPRLRTLLKVELPVHNWVEGFEVEHEFADSGRRIMRFNARRLNGKNELILLSIEDISEHHRAEQERRLATILTQDQMQKLNARLYECEQSYHRAHLIAIVDSSDDAIYSKDLQGVVRSWNSGAEQIFGYHAKEMIGKQSTHIVPPHLRKEEKQILEKLIRGERIGHYETLRVAKNGRLINISLTVSPIRDPSGRTVGTAKIARDITRQKQAEKELVDADRRKNEFLAMLAHELRNPLEAISSAVYLLQTTDREDQQHWGRQVIERQAGQLTRLIDELLDISRIMQGKTHLRKETLEAATVIAKAVETVQPLMHERRHTLRVMCAEKPLWLNADPARLEQILVNLLSNAGKYTDPGGLIEIIARREQSILLITVRDNGIGMSAETLSRAFELFAQNMPSQDRNDSGLGIGLTLVKTLTEMHGGSVDANSEGPGRGSELTLRFPLIEETRTSLTSTAPHSPAPGTSRHILIVDDNRDAADALSQLLQIMGHRVQTVYDGPAALESAAAFQPDTVLLDIGLPGLNGYEVAKRLRRIPGLEHTQLVAVSGYCQEEDRNRSRAAGFDHHLAKPVEHATLVELLAKPGLGR